MRDPLNFFSPYERLPAGHENQLTRGLLLLLRMSPLAHVEWLRLVAPTRSLGSLPAAVFDTQKRALRDDDDGEEQAELISVFLAPEQPQSGSGDVVESDRGQVLDAIVDYGELIAVIENKVFEADDLQARQINLKGADVQLVDGQEVVVVLWRDLLEALIGIRERNLIGGAEASILDDFLAYVEDHFPDLGPFRTLGLCGGISNRIERRLRQVLGEAAGIEAESSPYGSRVATPAGTVAGRDAYLTIVEGDEVELALYPADTLGQAREFYARSAAIEGVLKLAETDGWSVKPNFHFGHMQRGYCWTVSDIDMEDYLHLWLEKVPSTGNVPRNEWIAYWDWLVEQEIARREDLPEFDRHFTSTARKTATPRPGLYLGRRWPLAGAESLDSRAAFAPAVRDGLEQALKAVGSRGSAPDSSYRLASARTSAIAACLGGGGYGESVDQHRAVSALAGIVPN